MFLSLSCNKGDEPIQQNSQGYNMLLIGNSFFRPYAEKLDTMAIDAGFENHNSTTVFRGLDQLKLQFLRMKKGIKEIYVERQEG